MSTSISRLVLTDCGDHSQTVQERRVNRPPLRVDVFSVPVADLHPVDDHLLQPFQLFFGFVSKNVPLAYRPRDRRDSPQIFQRLVHGAV